MKIITKKNLNIRKAASTNGQRIGVIMAGNEIEVEGSVTGELVDGNSRWYYDKNQNYYWSGGAEIVEMLPKIVTAAPVVPAPGIYVDYNDWIIRDNPAIKNLIRNDAVKIAVMDSGIYEDHPDLKGAFDQVNLPSVSWITHAGPNDVHGHGSHVAGLIGGRSDDKLGIVGVASKSILQNIKVNDDAGNSSGSALMNGLNQISNAGNIDIVNLSLSITYREYQMVQNLLNTLTNRTIVVAAAGNNTTLITQGDICYPAFDPNVIAVGTFNLEFFRNNPSPKFHPRVEFMFPEFLLMSCATKEKRFYAEEMGSSMATALVSGLIGLLLDPANKTIAGVRHALNSIATPYSPDLNFNSLTLIKPK